MSRPKENGDWRGKGRRKKGDKGREEAGEDLNDACEGGRKRWEGEDHLMEGNEGGEATQGISTKLLLA